MANAKLELWVGFLTRLEELVSEIPTAALPQQTFQPRKCCLQRTCQAYGCLEFFAGKGWVSRVMKYREVPTASFDITYEIPGANPARPNAMDLLTDPGMATLSCIGPFSEIFWASGASTKPKRYFSLHW